MSKHVASLVSSILAFSTLVQANPLVEFDGRISLGMVSNQLAEQIQNSTSIHSDDAWYVRGIYHNVDFGFAIESVELGTLSELGFTPVEQDIFRISEFDQEEFLAKIDPDGPFGGGCSLVDSPEEWVVSNDSYWCDPEFTLKRTNAYNATEPLLKSGTTSRKDRIENGIWSAPQPMFEEIQSNVHGVGPYNGYISGTNKFTFEKISFVTQPNPVSLKEVESVVYRLSENEQLGFQYSSEYRSYQGFPRVQSNELRRRVSFTLEVTEVDAEMSSVYLVPDFWDSSLDYCPAASIEGQRCNLGYKGSVSVRFNNDALDDRNIAF